MQGTWENGQFVLASTKDAEIARLKDTARCYEELRSIIDGGSESMTHEDAVEALSSCLTNTQAQPAQSEPVANEIPLNIIRYWPDGFQDRLEHVWKDLIGFIPNYKLYDLQRVLAEFGFTMKVYEGDAPQPSAEVERLIKAVQNFRHLPLLGNYHKLRATPEYDELCNAWYDAVMKKGGAA